LVIVTANHISAPPGFSHPAALGIRIVRLPLTECDCSTAKVQPIMPLYGVDIVQIDR